MSKLSLSFYRTVTRYRKISSSSGYHWKILHTVVCQVRTEGDSHYFVTHVRTSALCHCCVTQTLYLVTPTTLYHVLLLYRGFPHLESNVIVGVTTFVETK